MTSLKTVVTAVTLILSLSEARAASSETVKAALHGYVICFIDTYARLQHQVGLNPAIDAANAACKPQLMAYRSQTDNVEATRLYISIIKSTKAGAFDNVKAEQ